MLKEFHLKKFDWKNLILGLDNKLQTGLPKSMDGNQRKQLRKETQFLMMKFLNSFLTPKQNH